MTVDPRGRIVVAGRGYIRVLVDDNGDGTPTGRCNSLTSPRRARDALGRGLAICKRRWRAAPFSSKQGWQSRNLGSRTASRSPDRRRTREPCDQPWPLTAGCTGCWEIQRVYGPVLPVETSPIPQSGLAGCPVRFTPDLNRPKSSPTDFATPTTSISIATATFSLTTPITNVASACPGTRELASTEIVPGGHYGWLNLSGPKPGATPPIYST